MGSLELVRPELPFATTCSMLCLAPTSARVCSALRYETTVRHSEAYQGEGSEGKGTSSIDASRNASPECASVSRCRSSCDVTRRAPLALVVCVTRRGPLAPVVCVTRRGPLAPVVVLLGAGRWPRWLCYSARAVGPACGGSGRRS